MKNVISIILLFLLVALTGACRTDSNSNSIRRQASSIVPSPSESASPTPTGLLSQQGANGCSGFVDGNPHTQRDVDADGTHMAYIVSVDPSRGTVTYDVFQWLSGDEAQEAYRRDTGDDGGPPNDYYIVNDSPRTRTLKVSRRPCIAIFESGDPNSDKALPNLSALAEYLDSDLHQGGENPPSDTFRLTKSGEHVTSIRQQWHP